MTGHITCITLVTLPIMDKLEKKIIQRLVRNKPASEMTELVYMLNMFALRNFQTDVERVLMLPKINQLGLYIYTLD